mmetsp:Transcript_13147/g.52470  ORF Transcript_13147/g.52470 Transcript_13147/m.52470 type:complete len:250 (-) Transcript_13147:2744-3493(-)
MASSSADAGGASWGGAAAWPAGARTSSATTASPASGSGMAAGASVKRKGGLRLAVCLRGPGLDASRATMPSSSSTSDRVGMGGRLGSSISSITGCGTAGAEVDTSTGDEGAVEGAASRGLDLKRSAFSSELSPLPVTRLRRPLRVSRGRPPMLLVRFDFFLGCDARGRVCSLVEKPATKLPRGFFAAGGSATVSCDVEADLTIASASSRMREMGGRRAVAAGGTMAWNSRMRRSSSSSMALRASSSDWM